MNSVILIFLAIGASSPVFWQKDTSHLRQIEGVSRDRDYSGGQDGFCSGESKMTTPYGIKYSNVINVPKNYERIGYAFPWRQSRGHGYFGLSAAHNFRFRPSHSKFGWEVNNVLKALKYRYGSSDFLNKTGGAANVFYAERPFAGLPITMVQLNQVCPVGAGNQLGLLSFNLDTYSINSRLSGRLCHPEALLGLLPDSSGFNSRLGLGGLNQMVGGLGFQQRFFSSVSTSTSFCRSIASIDRSQTSGNQGPQATQRSPKSNPSLIVSEDSLSLRSVSRPRLLYQIIGLQAVIFSLIGTILCLSRAFPYIPNGREGRWTALSLVGIVFFTLGIEWFITGQVRLLGL
jgi:hypothetical protein